jgi:hypothetical protein
MSDFSFLDHEPQPPSGDDASGWHEDSVRLSSSAHEAASKRSLDLASLAEALPRLGAVLWLDRQTRRSPSTRVMLGARGMLLLDHPVLATLSDCDTVTAHIAVTSFGPREWLCFRDAAGGAQGKMFLLPDTDYFAWDQMMAGSDLVSSPASTRGWHTHAAFMRCALARIGSGWRARLLRFDLQRLPWLRTLGACAPLRISLIGLELARSIARAEGAELISPLHTA